MANLTYDSDATALAMAQTIFGDGVTIVDATYTGDDRASAIYSNGDAVAPGVVPGDTGVILSTGIADRFTNANGFNQRVGSTTPNNGPRDDPDFTALAGRNTFDAAFLEVEFIPDADVNFITMEFVFASEEYPEFFEKDYNDLVGVWIDGELVPLAAGSGVSGVTSINPLADINLFNSNLDGTFNTEMDGFTVTMSFVIPVTPGVVNTLKIGIADVGDSARDSNLLIAADSGQGLLIANTDDVLLRPGTPETVDILANDINATNGAIFITHINDQPVSPGDSVVLTTGQTVTLNADGTIGLVGNEESEDVAFTYEIASTTGEKAVGFVIVDTVPCFVSGTHIRTASGKVPVEHLKPGQMVMTRDAGPQPIRWIGKRVLAAEGNMAPVRINAGTFGDHDTLMVSPLHRILIRNHHADLLFGSSEVLIAARDLIDSRNVFRVEGGMVEYVHILFDNHQVIWSEGLETESFLPGPQTTHCFEQDTVDEIRSIFPDLDPTTGKGYGPSARPALKRFEAKLLVA